MQRDAQFSGRGRPSFHNDLQWIEPLRFDVQISHRQIARSRQNEMAARIRDRGGKNVMLIGIAIRVKQADPRVVRISIFNRGGQGGALFNHCAGNGSSIRIKNRSSKISYIERLFDDDEFILSTRKCRVHEYECHRSKSNEPHASTPRPRRFFWTGNARRSRAGWSRCACLRLVPLPAQLRQTPRRRSSIRRPGLLRRPGA